ncbi:MAG: c-type cytochrome [Hyphomicrobiales bacterium]|nr:c-type cytochrome [Hyphomicrobiales bacterium]
MDSFELNKIAGTVLGVALVVMGLNMLGGIVVNPSKPKVPGYELPGGEVAAAPAAGPAAAADTPIDERMKVADAGRGERAVGACKACHSFENGGANKVGPNLWKVVDGPKAHVDGFGYSAALKERKAKGEKWGAAELDGFLKNPKAYLAGTTMGFAGIARPDQRADIVAYLASLK